MSRRYGRNQKRQARRRIAELEAKGEYAADLLRRTTRDRDRLQQKLDTVVEALGPTFVGLDAVHAAFKAVDADADRFQMLTPHGGVATMHRLLVSTQDAGDSPDSHLHILAELAGGAVGYAISQGALMHCEATFLARRLAMEIAPALVSHLRRNGARR